MREDIIKMAQEAGAMFDHMTWIERDLAPVFERFAALVADRCAEIADQAEPYQAADLIRKTFGVEK